MDRRLFLTAGGLAAAAPLWSGSAAVSAAEAEADGSPFQRVDFNTEGLGFTPREYALRLQEVVAATGLASDAYSRGGPIAELEETFARLLGKEAAMFVPTGTLANHLAVRKLAGDDRRVLVQAESHFYNDSGDGAQILSGLNVVPLAAGEATPRLDEVRRWVERSAGGRVQTRIGVLSIESPVRRRDHAMVDLDELRAVCAYARGQGIRLHLDGARLFNLPLHSGVGLKEHAALFDTVYVSLWKHFNASAGAILAGDADFIEGLFHTRRMFGGALPHAWPQAVLAGEYARGYEADYARAWQTADTLIERLQAQGRFSARKVAQGTSRFFLSVAGIDPQRLVDRAHRRGIGLPYWLPDTGEFVMQVNPTLLRRDPDTLAGQLIESLQG